jgi:excisionase family DNA binding protein
MPVLLSANLRRDGWPAFLWQLELLGSIRRQDHIEQMLEENREVASEVKSRTNG